MGKPINDLLGKTRPERYIAAYYILSPEYYQQKWGVAKHILGGGTFSTTFPCPEEIGKGEWKKKSAVFFRESIEKDLKERGLPRATRRLGEMESAEITQEGWLRQFPHWATKFMKFPTIVDHPTEEVDWDFFSLFATQCLPNALNASVDLEVEEGSDAKHILTIYQREHRLPSSPSIIPWMWPFR